MIASWCMPSVASGRPGPDSIWHSRLGDLAMAAGDLAVACTAYQTDLALAERLVAADPTNVEWQEAVQAVCRGGQTGDRPGASASSRL